MKNYRELEQKILDYADDNDLLSRDNLLGQTNKILRDTEALHLASRMNSQGRKEFITTGNKIVKVEDEVKSNFGKLLFNLIILAELQGVSLEEELEIAYKNK